MVVTKTIAIIKNSTRRKKILKKALIRWKLNAITIFVKLRRDNCLFLCLKDLCLLYTVLHIYTQLLFWAGNQGNHQNFDPSLLAKKLWLILMGMKPKKNSKMADSKKLSLLVLRLVGLIDAKGIDVVKPIWSWGCPM